MKLILSKPEKDFPQITTEHIYISNTDYPFKIPGSTNIESTPSWLSTSDHQSTFFPYDATRLDQASPSILSNTVSHSNEIKDVNTLISSNGHSPGITEPLLIWTLSPRPSIMNVRPSVAHPANSETPEKEPSHQTQNNTLISESVPSHQQIKSTDSEITINLQNTTLPSTATDSLLFWTLPTQSQFFGTKLPSQMNIDKPTKSKPNHDLSKPNLNDPLAIWTTKRPTLRPRPTKKPKPPSTESDELLFWTTSKLPNSKKPSGQVTTTHSPILNTTPDNEASLEMNESIQEHILQQIASGLLQNRIPSSSSEDSTYPIKQYPYDEISNEIVHNNPLTTIPYPYNVRVTTDAIEPVFSVQTTTKKATTEKISTTEIPIKPTSRFPIRSTSKVPMKTTTKLPIKSTSKFPIKSTTKMPVKSTTKRPIMETTSVSTSPSTQQTSIQQSVKLHSTTQKYTTLPSISSSYIPTTEDPISPMDQFITDFINSSPTEEETTTESLFDPPFDLDLLAHVSINK